MHAEEPHTRQPVDDADRGRADDPLVRSRDTGDRAEEALATYGTENRVPGSDELADCRDEPVALGNALAEPKPRVDHHCGGVNAQS